MKIKTITTDIELTEVKFVRSRRCFGLALEVESYGDKDYCRYHDLDFTLPFLRVLFTFQRKVLHDV